MIISIANGLRQNSLGGSSFGEWVLFGILLKNVDPQNLNISVMSVINSLEDNIQKFYKIDDS